MTTTTWTTTTFAAVVVGDHIQSAHSSYGTEPVRGFVAEVRAGAISRTLVLEDGTSLVGRDWSRIFTAQASK